MENKLVVGILNIVEDKLREFGVMLPDDDREDSKDPIVGYQYAELHDRIKEYLEEEGVMEEDKDFVRPADKVKVYGVSIVNPDGFFNGNDSQVFAFGSLQECLNYAYERYLATWKDIEEEGDAELLEEGLLSPAEFEREMMSSDSVVLQLPNWHAAFERFEWEVEVHKGLSVDEQIQGAIERAGGVRDNESEKGLEY